MNRLPGFENVKPPKPTIRDERVAQRIAQRIVAEVNLDEFYWESHEVEDRIFDIQQEIMRCGRPATVIGRLHQKQPPINCKGERGGHPYGWEGIYEHCYAIADDIAKEELEQEQKHWEERYA